jgi:hypothetical protein
MIRIMAAVTLALLSVPGAAPAQTNAAPAAQTPGAPAAAPAPAAPPALAQPLLNAGQLDALVAPIALYPNPLIAEILK